jgi:hypothetical protein
MKAAWTLLLALAMVCMLVASAGAEDKEVTLKGTITCAKCDLKLEKACATVIKVKDKDGKDVVYYFDPESGKKNHKAICTEAKEGTVKGTVSEKDGKKIITVAKDGVVFK